VGHWAVYGSGELDSWSWTVVVLLFLQLAAARTDRDALLAFKAAVSDPAVGNLTHFETLNLTANGISGSTPASLVPLRRLSYLSLFDSAFDGEVPGALRNCTCLSAAYLNSNRLTAGVPDWLDALQSLTALRLGQSMLSGRIPPPLANLTKIQMLELDQNLLEGGEPRRTLLMIRS
jgi:Leucine-rich repeat (LRR) protein